MIKNIFNCISIHNGGGITYLSMMHNDIDKKGNLVFLDQTQRAKRPIVQFEGNIQLFNYGNVGLRPIRAIETIN